MRGCVRAGADSAAGTEQVERNLARFPSDFMFQLSVDEEVALRSHFATSKRAGLNRGIGFTAKFDE